VSSPWDPNSAPSQPVDQPHQSPDGWIGNGVASRTVQMPATPPSSDEQWEYLDPSAYSNPYTQQPVYTSGPQPIPTMPPPPPAATLAPSDSSTTPPPATAGPWQGFGDSPPPPYGTGATVGGDPLSSANYEPEKGELKIKERRTWKTWQLLVAVILAAGVGMWFNGNSGSASSTSATSGYKLPPPSSSAKSSTTVGDPAASGAGSTVTTAAGTSADTAGSNSTTTTGATAGGGDTSTTTATAVGPATVLIPQTEQTGNWTSPAFTIAGGTWNIGWAFQCAPAPTGAPSFQIFVTTAGGGPGSTPAITSSAASGQAVTPQTTAGSQQIMVQTTAACRWAVKVTGSSS
jgi:hypothetical protein